MSAPITTDPAAEAAGADPAPVVAEAVADPPAGGQAAEPAAEQADQSESAAGELSHADALAALAKVRKEAAGYRTRLRDAEPILQAHQAAEDAAKTDLERANERIAQMEAAAAERDARDVVAEVAAAHGISADNLDLLGSGTREELDARAQRVAALAASSRPPTDRPVESLKPGASSASTTPVDDAYPAGWRPRHLPNK